jgi:hypothetical protein
MRRAALLSLLALLLAAPAAQAAHDPLGQGTTRLALDKRFLAFLKKDRIAISAKAPAAYRRGALLLPLSGGSFDPALGKGEIDTAGTFTLTSPRHRLPFKQLVVKSNRTPLQANVSGSHLKLVTARSLSHRRDGFGVDLLANGLTLSAKLATRLNRKLQPTTPFQEGQPFGKLVARAQPLTVSILEKARATLVFDPSFLAKLDSHYVSLNPIFPAEHQGGTFTFPIVGGGTLAPDLSQGTLRSGGEVEALQLGGGQIFWHEPWLDFGARVDSAEANVQPSPPYAGKTGRIGLFDLGMAGAAVSSDPGARTISVSGGQLTLEASAATELNEAFANGKEDFRAGEALGSVSFTAWGQ